MKLSGSSRMRPAMFQAFSSGARPCSSAHLPACVLAMTFPVRSVYRQRAMSKSLPAAYRLSSVVTACLRIAP